MSLYMFLLHHNNLNKWVEWMKVPYESVMMGAGISSKKTYYSCLDDLVNWGLIKYQKGVNNWQSPLIKVEVLKDTSTVPVLEPLPAPPDVPAHILALILAATPVPIPNIKQLTLNLKPITLNIKRVLQFLEIDFEEEKSLDDIEETAKERQGNEEVENSIMKFFGFNELKDFGKLRSVSEFCYCLKKSDRLEKFKIQFEAYKKLKSESPNFIHGFDKFLGTQASIFEDGGWNAENWIHKLSEHQKSNQNGKSNLKPTAKRIDPERTSYGKL